MSTLKRRVLALEAKVKPESPLIVIIRTGGETPEQQAQIQQAKKQGRDVTLIMMRTVSCMADKPAPYTQVLD